MALFLAGALALAAAGCGSSDGGSAAPTTTVPSNGRLEVANARIDEPVNGTTAVVRMDIANGTEDADRLITVSSPVASLVTLHTSETDAQGRDTMKDLTAIAIPAGKVTAFKAGGLHVMLERFDEKDLKLGDEVMITLTFAKAGSKTVTAKVVPIGSGGSDGEMDHDMEHGKS